MQGRVGEHYISTDRTGYRKMYKKKAAIGGLFIGFMATLKMLSYHVVLAPIGRAFVNSMIYGFGLCFYPHCQRHCCNQAASNDSSNRINHLWLIRQKKLSSWQN